MKSFFLDTNIIIDLLAERTPHSKFAIQLLEAAEKKKIQLFTSSHSIATTYYVLEKLIDEKTLRQALDNLIDIVQPIAIDLRILKRAMKSNHPDLEDAIQIFAASTESQISYIITRNIKDFKNSPIQAIAPDQAINLI
ncbi:MAG: PIN domain-containing protein [Saprospiraceae bacterium]|uniref:PIN domain-containing protein n=1 Tax=Candidatus Opimibacter skivensis TaxID=2982028 RepID=A0A9D7XMZ3_9BACT|nr:PIN domain-containing protein [Candidatus Opimibacter skivensis]